MKFQLIDPLMAICILLLEIMSFSGVFSLGYDHHLCRKLEELRQESRKSMGGHKTVISGHDHHAHLVLNCLDPDSMVQVDTQKVGTKVKVTVTTCPKVLEVLMHVGPEGNLPLQDVNQMVASCKGERNTLLIHVHPAKGLETYTVTIATRPSTTPKIGNFRLSWAYQYVTNLNYTAWSSLKEQLECRGDSVNCVPLWTLNQESNQESNQWSKRERRSQQQSENSTSIQNDRVCGKDQSCIRFGKDNCSHLQCDYLLIYSIKNLTFLELEISGKATGWVALGLSSDDKMGGDGVIACKRKTTVKKEVEALSMWINLAHSRPRVKDNVYSLVAHNTSDGFIYCKMTSSLLSRGRDDTSLDLTNNWYQFYAKGDLDSTGLILKHNEVPPISTTTISMLRPVSIHSRHYKQLESSSSSIHIYQSHQMAPAVLITGSATIVINFLHSLFPV